MNRLPADSALAVLRRAVGRGDVSLSRLVDQDHFGARSARDRWAAIEAALRSGRLVVAEKRIPMENYRHDLSLHEQATVTPPARERAPIADSISLMISRCDPELLDGPLKFTYLVRGLEGRLCKLRIVSDTFPGRVVHERDLDASETSDGPHDAEWDGEITAPGSQQGKRLSSAYSPARVELVHNDVYQDQAPFTLSRRVHVVELEDIVFATGRALLLPDGGTGGGAEMAERGGLDAVAAVLRHTAEHDDQALTIFGHTDTVGSDSSNLALSEDRATNALHVVTGEVDPWASHCDEHFDVADYQRVLAWVARTFGWPTDPGPIDGEFGPMTREARSMFRERMNAEYGTALEEGSKQGLDDWKAYFSLYDEELMRLLDWPREELDRVRTNIHLTDPAAVGCGEAWPAEGEGQNNLASASNRRVDFVFFEPGEVPELPGEPPGHELYGTNAYRADYIPYDSSDVVIEATVRRLQLGCLEYRTSQVALLPEPEVSHSPWSALIAAARHMEASPEDIPAFFFHQHPDEDAHLSDQRAKAGYAFVRDDRDLWVELQREHGSIHDVQQVLLYLEQVKAWPTPVELSGEADEQTESAVLEFQRTYNDGYSDSIDEDGIVGPQTLGALFTVLRDDLVEWFELNEADYAQLYHLPESAFVGCGSIYAGRERFGIGTQKVPAAMLDVLFVPPGEPLDVKTKAPGRGVYVPQLEFELIEIKDIEAPRTHLLVIKLIDRKGAPIREAEYELRVGSDHRHGTTNFDGEIVEARLGEGIPVVRLLDGRLLVFHDRYAHSIEHGEAADLPPDPYSPLDEDATEHDPTMDVETLLAEEGGL